jgi:hypothetical protein
MYANLKILLDSIDSLNNLVLWTIEAPRSLREILNGGVVRGCPVRSAHGVFAQRYPQ